MTHNFMFDLSDFCNNFLESHPEAKPDQVVDAMQMTLDMLSSEISEQLEQSFLWHQFRA